MREIKFRAWDKEENIMIDADSFYFSEEFEPFVDSVRRAQGRFVIMQYTGLKDKNGKEIYEGDIVLFEIWHGGVEHLQYEEKNPGHNWRYPYLVVWELGHTFIKQSCLENYPETTELRHAIEDKNLEIIGNVYENSDLHTKTLN